MTRNRKLLHRLLMLETFLALVGIGLVSCLYLHALGQQQQISENLFQHPFAVSNAGIEFRSDVLELRNRLLEAMVSRKPFGNPEDEMVHRLEDHMERQLTIIRNDFLGDRARVDSIIREMGMWKQIRNQVVANLREGKFDDALPIAMNQAAPHIEHIIRDTDYVMSFAHSRAQRFIEEGRAKLAQARLLLGLLSVLSVMGYWILTNKIRQQIRSIYDIEEYNATYDELCHSYNRRTFFNLFNAEIQRSLRHNLQLSLLMMDLDHFKGVNDSYGHDAGDTVLCQFATVCSRHLRMADLFGRLGGEEFAILLPQTDINEAMDVAERIRREIAGNDFEIANGKRIKLTVSIGVVALDSGMATLEALLKHADSAMYDAKNYGRNRVVPWLGGNDLAGFSI